MTWYQWEILGRVRMEALMREAQERHFYPRVSSGSSVARFLIWAGRGLERLGERLAGGQVRDVAMGGTR